MFTHFFHREVHCRICFLTDSVVLGVAITKPPNADPATLTDGNTASCLVVSSVAGTTDWTLRIPLPTAVDLASVEIVTRNMPCIDTKRVLLYHEMAPPEGDGFSVPLFHFCDAVSSVSGTDSVYATCTFHCVGPSRYQMWSYLFLKLLGGVALPVDAGICDVAVFAAI